MTAQDALLRHQATEIVNQILAEDVIGGRMVHNVETDELAPAELASDEFRAEAVAAYKRLLERGSSPP